MFIHGGVPSLRPSPLEVDPSSSLLFRVSRPQAIEWDYLYANRPVAFEGDFYWRKNRIIVHVIMFYFAQQLLWNTSVLFGVFCF